jgi:hypothetical protein
MSNAYYLVSGESYLVLDIKVPVESGSPLQALVRKTENNQLWTFERVSPTSEYFYIVSADQGLSVDIKVPVESGAPLQALIRKTETNQQWRIVPYTNVGQGTVDDLPQPLASYFFIRSAAADLVVSVEEENGKAPESGARINIAPEKSGDPATSFPLPNSVNGNQLWSVNAPATYTYDPKVELTTPRVVGSGLSFGFNATGFFPGGGLTCVYSLVNGNGDFDTNDQFPPVFTADFGGSLSQSLSTTLPAGTTGPLTVTLTDTFNALSATVTKTLDAAGQLY